MFAFTNDDSESSSVLSEDSSLGDTSSSCYTEQCLSTIWEETSQDLRSISFRRVRRSGSIDLPPIPPAPSQYDCEGTPKMGNCRKVAASTSVPRNVSLRSYSSFSREDDFDEVYEDHYNDLNDLNSSSDNMNVSSRNSISLTLVRTGQTVLVSTSDDEFTFESCSTGFDLDSKISIDSDSLSSFECDENDFNEGGQLCDMGDALKDEPAKIRGHREALLTRTQHRPEGKLDFHIKCISRQEAIQLDPLRRKINYSINSKRLRESMPESSFFREQLRHDKHRKHEGLDGHRRSKFLNCQLILENKIGDILSSRNLKQEINDDCEAEMLLEEVFKSDTPFNPQDDFNASSESLEIEDIQADKNSISEEAASSAVVSCSANKRANLMEKIHRIEDRLEKIRCSISGESHSSFGEDSVGSRGRDPQNSSPGMIAVRKSHDVECQEQPRGRLASFQLRKQSSLRKLQSALNVIAGAISTANP